MNLINQRYETVSVDSIQPHPRNVNQGDLDAIGESIDTNGWFGAVLVQESTGNILAGSHRWMAAREAGAETLPALIADVDDDQAVRIMLGDNRTARLGEDRLPDLAGLLQELDETELKLEGTGFSPEYLNNLLEEMDTEVKVGSSSTNVPGDGSLLALADVSFGEPNHTVFPGDIYAIGRHRLICADVMDGWPIWSPFLVDDALFVPYPGPYAAVSVKADEVPLVLVQPDPFLAGHVLDKYAAMRGDDAIERLND